MNKKYEFTRSIRFGLDGQNLEKLNISVSSDENYLEIFDSFQDSYTQMIEFFERAVYQFYASGDRKISPFIEIKYPWIRKHAKSEYYHMVGRANALKKYSIKEAPFLQKKFDEWVDVNKILLKDIQDTSEREAENLAKKSDALLLIKQFLSDEYLYFVRDLMYSINNKKSSAVLEQLEEIIKNIEDLSEQLIYALAPNQSGGMEIARGTSNYYTVNKISKNFDKDLSTALQKLSESYRGIVDGDLLRKVQFKAFIASAINESVYGSNEIKRLSVENMYKALKDFKAQQKSEFLEKLQRDVSMHNTDTCLRYIKAYFPLFDIKRDKLKEFLEITEKIEQLSERNNHAVAKNDCGVTEIIGEKIRKNNIIRGKFYKFHFENYSKYCAEFKKVAMSRGQLRAQVHSIKQEKIESRLLQYWTHFVEKDGQKYVLMIPKTHDSLHRAKNYLAQRQDGVGEYTLYYMNSLTLRALNKLIRKNLTTEIPDFHKRPIQFYKDVLMNKYPSIIIDHDGYENEIRDLAKKDFVDEEDFRMELEKVAYFMKKIVLSQNDIDYFVDTCGGSMLRVTGYDLTRKIVSPLREFTQVWNQFWMKENFENHFPIRINPEMRVFYRRAQEDLPQEKKHNRFSHTTYTIAFTMTQNAAQKRFDTAFVDVQEIANQVTQFNTGVIGDFIKENGENLYYYGIDRGNQELATLGVVQWSKEEYQATLCDGSVKNFSKPLFPEIATYKMNEPNQTKNITIDIKGNQKKITISDNPSYFIDEEMSSFKEKKVAFIDLTTAKLIKGKIILDGDTKTYINLKKANAKRKIFENFTKIDSQSHVEFCDKKHPAYEIEIKNKKIFQNSFLIKHKAGEREQYSILCYFSVDQEKIILIDAMQKDLQSYLDDMRQDCTMQTVTVEQINHLRDAITANMVGIIAHLFAQYPGIINLENLHSTDEIGRHFQASNENIARRLEWALYRKFQKIGLVPPRLKQTIFLREDKESYRLNQFGIIHFIPTKETSATCPYCGENTPMPQRQEDKFERHAYICRKNNKYCGFDTRKPSDPLTKINNSDSVAAYNIAKSKIE